ncbi:hypothetical protein [Leeuwenhoekiella blandensis]|uniref:Beta-glucosidase n=1 Tax=Leeuwenhoekiella blandensis (strain CECT 7118 / CCUG 51940 / KCTC 22103 / MED217) TaxID=398720 RepID=A3XJ57_LEEBM|nr:hypothetical protein [Leeuwenhoekiella blandensis]EAQ50417.1 hypothetical protein MED217_05277 [Leeuwenhoekiella blandensis MED217]
MKQFKIVLITVFAPLFASQAQTNGINDLDPVVEHKIDSILELMTVKEKVGANGAIQRKL